MVLSCSDCFGKGTAMNTFVLTIAMILSLWSGTAPQVAEAPLPTPEPTPAPRVLTVCVGTQGHTIDPAYLSDGEDVDYLRHLFEGLMKYAPVTTDGKMNDMALTYGLAEAAEMSADGLTYRFTLRGDALWSDGVPVRAADFVYAWNRLLQTDSHGAAQLSAVLESVTAESDRVLIAALKAPCPWFLKLCAEVYTAPVRRDLVETYGGDWTQEEHIAVSGAYTIASWVHDDHILLRRNPCYYGRDTLTADTIAWYFRDTVDRLGADFTADVPASDATGRVDKAGVYYLYLNANGIRDWRVRAAMTLAVDREAVAEAAGSGRAAWGMVPAGISRTDGTAYDAESAPMLQWLQKAYPAYDLRDYEGRCALAADLYNQAVASGAWSYGCTLRYRCNASAVNERVFAQCQADWLRVLGLTVTACPMTAEDYEKLLPTNTFDVAYLSWMADYDDPLCFLRIMERGGEANYSAWGDVRYNDLLERCVMDGDDRDGLLTETDSALFESERFAVCPLYWFGEYYAAADDVTGVAHSAYGGYWFGNVNREHFC